MQRALGLMINADVSAIRVSNLHFWAKELLLVVRGNMINLGMLPSTNINYTTDIEVKLSTLAEKAGHGNRFQFLIENVFAGIDPITQLEYVDKPPSPNMPRETIVRAAVHNTPADFLRLAKSPDTRGFALLRGKEMISLGLQYVISRVCDEMSSSPAEYDEFTRSQFLLLLYKTNVANYTIDMQELAQLLTKNKPNKNEEVSQWQHDLLNAAYASNNLLTKRQALQAILGKHIKNAEVERLRTKEDALEFINNDLKNELDRLRLYQAKPSAIPNTKVEPQAQAEVRFL